jgi:hypothetical protein
MGNPVKSQEDYCRMVGFNWKLTFDGEKEKIVSCIFAPSYPAWLLYRRFFESNF